MTRTLIFLYLIGFTGLFLLGMVSGCEPKGSVTSGQVPPALKENNKASEFSYRHEVRLGGAGNALREELRKEYVVAVARVGDTSSVDTPFGDRALVVDSVQLKAKDSLGQETEIKVQTAEKVAQTRLQPEPTPPGFTATARNQLVFDLQRVGLFTVVERDSVNDVVRELKFGESKWVAKEDAVPTGNLQNVRYIIKGGLELNREALTNKIVTSDNWVGKEGFPEKDNSDMPFVFRLRMYSVETGVIVAVGDGYGLSSREAIANSVTSLTNAIVRYHKTHTQ